MNNFTLTRKTNIKSLNCPMYEYKHISGARLVYLELDTEEKTFGAGFKTVPSDSTGVFHILEHSILSGSKKYPVASPILYMLKNSMNTFLNAITYQGKTVYPCASCNDKDFENLMRVYLDAVFNPILSRDTFMREGWHLERNGDEYDIRGVVYNEMQGATAMPESIMYEAMTQDLYPDTYQGHNSGGDPDSIPLLTYEKYIDTYNEFYSASNSVLFLSGKMNFEKYAEIIDEYLLSASQIDAKHEYSLQNPIINEKIHTFPVDDKEKLKGNTNIVFSYNVGKMNPEKSFAVQILSSLLVDNNSSVLKAAIMNSGLVKNVECFITDEEQIGFGIAVYHTDKENKDAIASIISETISNLCKEGINKQSLKAVISRYSFIVRERFASSQNQGVMDFLNVTDNIFRSMPAETYFDCDEMFDKLEAAIEENYYEKLLKEIFLDNNHRAVSLIVPVLTNMEAVRKDRVNAVLNRMSEEAIEKSIKESGEFALRQNSTDDEKAVAKMPVLSVSDISKNVVTRHTEVLGDKFFTKADTNGIAYVRLYFPMEKLNKAELMSAKFMASCLSVLPTENNSSETLSDKIKLYTGRLQFSPEAYARDVKTAYPYFVITAAFLEKNKDEVVKLIEEILNSTVFDGEKVNNLLKQEITSVKLNFEQNGINLAVNQALSEVGMSGKYKVLFGGYDYWKFINEQIKNVKSFINKLELLVKKIFVSDGMKIGVTGDEKIKDFEICLPCGEKSDCSDINVDKSSVAFDVASQVSYNVRAMDYSEILPFGGKHIVMKNILSLGYLWHNIREKGGAYGTNITFMRDGSMFVYSYRDPYVAETYNVYNGIADFIEKGDFSEKEINGCIISSIAELTNPITAERESVKNETQILSGLKTDINALIDEITSFKKEDIKEFIPVFRAFGESKCVCSVGNGEKQQASGIFSEIVHI